MDGITDSRLRQLGTLTKTPQHILFYSDSPMQATGSSVWNGGNCEVHGWLNLKVSSHTDNDESPACSLQRYANQLQISAPLAGMMTAASMNSLRLEIRGDEHITVACIVTAGIENARRTGDPCDQLTTSRFGTINIALISNAGFSPAARIEALMLATEAKTAACYDLEITSPVSHLIATGTGTDSICLLSSTDAEQLEYCGKHTRLGEWIGSATYSAVFDSLQACISLRQSTA